jgi:RNA-directed DNA polymerase
MSLTTPLSVQKLQTALHDKAKGSPKFRFYALYDKVHREDVMAFAYEYCKANVTAPDICFSMVRLRDEWTSYDFSEVKR